MTDGLNLTGFNETGEQSGSNDLNLHLSDAPGKAFASSDMSSQGNAGLNQEGSSDTGTDAPGVSEGMYS